MKDLPNAVFLYLELLDFQIQCRPRNSELGCRPARPRNFAFAFRKSRLNEFLLIALHGLCQTPRRFRARCVLAGKPGLIDPEGIPRAKDDTSLNDILQLTDIARPI